MLKKIIFLIVFLSILKLDSSQILKISLPKVSTTTQNNVNFQINLLKILLPTYNWLFCNKPMLYKTVVRASEVLHSATCQMKNAAGNVVQGSNNTVIGVGNTVIGSNDTVVGIGNWCFASNYSTKQGTIDEGILVIGNYKIILAKAALILQNPKQTITTINKNQYNTLRSQNVALSYFFAP